MKLFTGSFFSKRDQIRSFMDLITFNEEILKRQFFYVQWYKGIPQLTLYSLKPTETV